MQIFLAWRPMEDRIGAVGNRIESFLWGDARARHTYLIAATNDRLPVVLEIDVGDTQLERMHVERAQQHLFLAALQVEREDRRVKRLHLHLDFFRRT